MLNDTDLGKLTGNQTTEHPNYQEASLEHGMPGQCMKKINVAFHEQTGTGQRGMEGPCLWPLHRMEQRHKSSETNQGQPWTQGTGKKVFVPPLQNNINHDITLNLDITFDRRVRALCFCLKLEALNKPTLVLLPLCAAV